MAITRRPTTTFNRAWSAPGVSGTVLPLAQSAHSALDPIAAILSFYVMAADLAVARGRNPDTPRHLNKVTETH